MGQSLLYMCVENSCLLGFRWFNLFLHNFHLVWFSVQQPIQIKNDFLFEPNSFYDRFTIQLIGVTDSDSIFKTFDREKQGKSWNNSLAVIYIRYMSGIPWYNFYILSSPSFKPLYVWSVGKSQEKLVLRYCLSPHMVVYYFYGEFTLLFLIWLSTKLSTEQFFVVFIYSFRYCISEVSF